LVPLLETFSVPLLPGLTFLLLVFTFSGGFVQKGAFAVPGRFDGWEPAADGPLPSPPRFILLLLQCVFALFPSISVVIFSFFLPPPRTLVDLPPSPRFLGLFPPPILTLFPDRPALSWLPFRIFRVPPGSRPPLFLPPPSPI